MKAYSMLDEPTYLALADAADDAGLPFVGHMPERVAFGTALAVGQDGIEYFGRVTMACATAEAEMVAALRDVMTTGADRGGIFSVMAARNRIVLESWNEDRQEQCRALWLAKPLLAQVMPPSINLLPPEIMALSNLRHRRAVTTHLAHHSKLLGIRPTTPTFNRTQKITSHAALT